MIWRFSVRPGLWVAAAVVAIAPALFIAFDRTPPSATRWEPVAPLAIVPAPEPSATGRRLFGTPPAHTTTGDGGDAAPVLLGVVGRLGADAVALVRTRDGAVRTVAMGAIADGWRLDAIAPDAALFTRGERRVRAELPLGDTDLPSN